MADEAGGTPVVSLGIEYGALLQGLKDIESKINATQAAMTAAFSKPISISIDTSQFDRLTKYFASLRGTLSNEFGTLGNTISNEMGKSTAAIVGNLSGIEFAIQNLSAISARVGKEISDSLSAGAKTGTQAIVDETNAASAALQNLATQQERVVAAAATQTPITGLSARQTNELQATINSLKRRQTDLQTRGFGDELKNNLASAGFANPNPIATNSTYLTSDGKGGQIVDQVSLGQLKAALDKTENTLQQFNVAEEQLTEATLTAAATRKASALRELENVSQANQVQNDIAQEAIANARKQQAGFDEHAKSRLEDVSQLNQLSHDAALKEEAAASESAKLRLEAASFENQAAHDVALKEEAAVAAEVAAKSEAAKLVLEAASQVNQRAHDLAEAQDKLARQLIAEVGVQGNAGSAAKQLAEAEGKLAALYSSAVVFDQKQFGTTSQPASAGLAAQRAVATAPLPSPASVASAAGSGGGGETITLLDAIQQRHDGINASLNSQTLKLLASIAVYRVIRDSLREIEGLISGFVQAGLDYTKQLDTQKQQLAGVLVADFNITDAQGRQLQGADKVRAAVTEAARQQALLANATKGTAATATELSQIYSEIAAPITAVGGGMDKLQQVTHLSAQVAETMGVSYKEIGTELTSMMGGTGGNSKLARALSIDAATLKALKDTPQLLDLIITRMTALASGHDQGLAGTLVQFKEIVGLISSNIEAPILGVFKDLVDYLTKLKENAGFQDFLVQLKSGVSDAAGQLEAFGQDLARTTTNTGPLVLGLRDIVTGLLAVTSAFVGGTKAVVEFIGNNLGMIKAFAWVASVITAITYIDRLGGVIRAYATELGALYVATMKQAQAELDLAAASRMEQAGIEQASAAAAVGKTAFLAFAEVVMSLGTTLVIGGALYGISLLVQKFYEARDAADAARASMAKLSTGDVNGAILEKAKELGSSDLDVRTDAGRVYGASVDSVNEQLAKRNLTMDTAIDKILEFRRTQDDLNRSISNGTVVGDINIASTRAQAASNASAASTLQDLVAAGAFAKQGVAALQVDIDAWQAKVNDAKAQIAAASKRGTTAGYETKGGGFTPYTDVVSHGQSQIDLLRQEQEKVRALANQYAAGQLRLQPQNDFQAKINPLVIPPPKEDLSKPPSFKSQMATENEALSEEVATYKKIYTDKLVFDGQLIISDQDMANKILDVEARRRVLIAKTHDDELAELVVWRDKRLAADKAMTDKDRTKPSNAPTIYGDFNSAAKDVDDRAARAVQESTTRGVEGLDTFAKATADKAKLRVQLTAQAEEQILKLYGDTDQKIEVTERARIAKLHDDMIAAGKPKDEVDAITARENAALPTFIEREGLKAWAQSAGQYVASVRQQEAFLEQQLNKGTVSINGYVAQASELRDEHVAAIQQQIDATQALYELSVAHPISDTNEQNKALQALIDKTRQLHEELASLSTANVEKFTSTFKELGNVAGKMGTPFGDLYKDISKIIDLGPDIEKLTAHVLDFFKSVSPGGNGSVISGVENIFKSTASYIGSSIKAIGNVFGGRSHFQLAGGPDTGSSATDIPSGAAASAASDAPVIAGAAAVSSTAAVTAGASLAVAAAITIGVNMFNNAVDAAKKKLSASLQAVADDLRAGIITTGESEQALELARQKAIEQNSGSKSGRDALDSLLPQFDEQIKQAQAANLATQKAFQDNLRGLTAGVGAYGDFARTLFDLQDKAKTYLDSFPHSGIDANGQQFTATTQQDAKYAEALAQVTQLFTLTMDGLRNQLITQQQGFEQTAIASAQHVIDLGDQLTQLYQQLAANQLAKNRLTEDMADEPRKEALQWAKIQDDRVKHVQQVLDLEKQIADVITQAAQSEADIRRQGVVEAQETIAQTKARQISVVRNNAADQITGLNRQLTDLNNPLNYDYEQQVKDFIQQTTRTKEDQAIELQNLTDQTAQIQQQIRLDNIGLGYAEQVAAIETAVYGIDRDRYALADRSGQISVESAKTATIQWGQVKSLIDSIVETADGVVFNTPPGFPQIKVDIGTIHIDNSGTTINTTGGSGSVNGGDTGTYSPGPSPGTSRWNAPAGYHVGSYDDDGRFWGPDRGFTLAQWLVPNIANDRAPAGFHTGTQRDPGAQEDPDLETPGGPKVWIVPDHQGDIWQRQALP